MENLKPRQDSFCVHYTTIGSETYSNGTKAALAAGYSEKSSHVTATKLLKQDAIRERIVELQVENMKRNLISVDKVLADLEHDKLMAREHKQFAVSKACTELQGKYLEMFSDKAGLTGKGLQIIIGDKSPEEKGEDEEKLPDPKLKLHGA
ncbi:terminase small subunit [Planctomycetota bacterium]